MPSHVTRGAWSLSLRSENRLSPDGIGGKSRPCRLAAISTSRDSQTTLFDQKASGSSLFPHQNVDSHARQVRPFAPSGTRPDLSSSKSV